MLTEKIEKILNEQIAKEGYSSNLYLAMASYAETNGYEGTSEWLYAQAEEEKQHMLKFIHYVNARGGHAKISAMEEPPLKFGTIRDLFEKVYEHEQYISASINEIVGACMDERDFTTHNWIQWFVTEQIEEEATVSGILDKLKLLEGKSLYHFDRDLMASRGQQEAL